jgi:sigma-B regulation protein RsbU (phosphoserine phosphatase)
MGLMPKESPPIAGFAIAGRCIPANHVGGDFFQYFLRPDDRLTLALADVTGHSMDAAIPMVLFSGILKSQMELGGNLEELFSRLNRSLYGALPRRTFVCCAMGELELSSRLIRLANCGCPYPYYIQAATGEVQEVQVGGIPMGVQQNTSYEAGEVQLEAGDWVVFCSDGIPEAMDGLGEMLGFERVAEVLHRACVEGGSAEGVIDRMLSEVRAFTGGTPQSDDITCVVVRVEDER